MSKPNWQDAPEWANYLACDYEGGWWWYENKPVFDEDCWVCESSFVGHVEHAMDDDNNPGASSTLEPRP